jgi:peptide/nickel transport system permease protein
VWTYIARRLLVMIPTLFGVTIVSFVIMQLAPGDPVQSQLGSGGSIGAKSQNREAYLIQKRDLKLDKPLLLNYRYFFDYAPQVALAARWRAISVTELAEELAALASDPRSAENAPRVGFLRSLDVGDFNARFRPPALTDQQLAASGMTRTEWEAKIRERRLGLAAAVQGLLVPWCEDVGLHGLPAAIALLNAAEAPQATRAGASQCLTSMIPTPFEYTFSRQARPTEDARVVATWRRLWEQESSKFSAVDPDRKRALATRLNELASLNRAEMFAAIQGPEFSADDVPFFVEVIQSDAPRTEKTVAAEFVKLYVSARLQLEVSPGVSDEKLHAVAQNWSAHYDASRPDYEFGLPAKIGYSLVDTQYAHMVWRLVTFQFGRSTLRTREPVSERLWSAAVVSVPLMLMAELLIYGIAVPAGVVAAANRGRLIDRSISLSLFLLYSVPPFVAGMLFLLFLCYGDYLKWFPMERLHSEGAEGFGFGRYLADYFWHATLPVICLSLFSLAGLAMYGRSAMLDVLDQDYIRTARAKGAPEWRVVLVHALRNSLIPFITLFASFIPGLLGGSVLVEYLFNIPGMGRLGFSSIIQKDYPTLMALIYIDAIVVMLSILLADLLYVLVDPRISFQGRGGSA